MSKTLLLADDSVTIQKVVGISFASEDVTLVTVDNGDDAITKAREVRPDVILADVVMPGKNGYEVCEAVKADPELRHIPVLLLTGTFEAFDEQRATAAGAAGHVAKPFEAQTLVEQVRRLLRESAAAPPAPQQPPVAAVTAPARPAAPRPAAAPSAAPPAPTAAPASPPRPAPAAAAPPRPPVAPSAPPPTAPAVPTRPPEESFDFFDDDLMPSASPSPAADTAPRGEPNALDLSSPDAAFAFGDDDLASEAADPALASPPPLAPAAPKVPPGDRTVAILPDEPPPLPPSPMAAAAGSQPEPPQATVLDLDPLDLSPGTPSADELDVDSLSPMDPTGRSAGGGFDFDFEGETPAPAEDPVLAVGTVEPLDTLDTADVAQATVLDPNGASGYDVSSSDLGDSLVSGPTAPLASSPPEPPAAPEFELPEPPEVPDVALAEPPAPPPPPAAPRRAPEAAAIPVSEALAQTEPEAGVPVQALEPLDDDPITDAEAISLPEEDPFAEPMEVEAYDAPPPPARVEVEETPDLAPRAADAAARALEEITPQLREQLHDTLEKIAWESFSDVTEKIIQQAVERVEKIAWEVIPELAETLVREEIRKMKGES